VETEDTSRNVANPTAHRNSFAFERHAAPDSDDLEDPAARLRVSEGRPPFAEVPQFAGPSEPPTGQGTSSVRNVQKLCVVSTGSVMVMISVATFSSAVIPNSSITPVRVS
jgi:hypothetical protein